MNDLAALVTRAQHGDAEAYETLVRRFQDMAVGYSYAVLGDLQLAEDAAQEAFIAAYYDLGALREPAAFPGWFRRIVFKYADRLRRGKQTLPLSEAAVLAAHEPGPAETAERHELQTTLLSAIRSLPDPHREVVTLFYISEHTLREISTFLEIPLGTVKTRLHSARQQLKARMITIMHDHLADQRPSRNDEFANKVIRLFRATIEGDTPQVRALLSEDTRLASANGMVSSPLWQSQAPAPALHVAVMHGRKDIADLLLAHGADINERDERWKFTALHHAIDLDFMADYAALGMVDFLLERGAEKDVFACLWLGEHDRARAMIEQNPALVNAIGPGNASPLCYAHSVEMAQFLLDHGADIFQRLDSKLTYTTPLRWLAKFNHDLLRYLLDRAGIAPDVFLIAVMGDMEQVTARLDADPALVNARTGPDHVLDPGLTLLHIAVQYGHIEIARRLIDRGADVNATASGVLGMTPLHLAICDGTWQEDTTMPGTDDLLTSPGVLRLVPDMPRLLLEHGADVSARDSVKHLTPLGWAETNQEDEIDRREVAALLREFAARG